MKRWTVAICIAATFAVVVAFAAIAYEVHQAVCGVALVLVLMALIALSF